MDGQMLSIYKGTDERGDQFVCSALTAVSADSDSRTGSWINDIRQRQRSY